jgi:hypothetical protein
VKTTGKLTPRSFRIIQEGISTALVIEDDADWDVMIKGQLTELAKGSQHIMNTPTPHSPYGDGWWYIATGHCSVGANPNIDQPHWIVENDPTVPPDDQRSMFFFGPLVGPKQLAGPNKRLLFGLDRFMCTGSYAVSLAGAKRIIYDQEVELHGQTIDMAVSDLCKREGETSPPKCLGTYPALTGIYVAAGDAAKTSDRTEEKGRVENPFAVRLVYSTRLNLGPLLKGETKIKSQWPDQTLYKEVDITSAQYPVGGPVMVTKGDYKAAAQRKRGVERIVEIFE